MRPAAESAAGAESDMQGAADHTARVSPQIVSPLKDRLFGSLGALDTRLPAGFGTVTPALADQGSRNPLPSDQPVGSGTGDASSEAVITASPAQQTVCEPRTYENGLANDHAAMRQVAVQNSDCTWGGSQVIVSADPRGPPGVDVLVQSNGVTVDVEAYVTNEKVRLDTRHRGRDGEELPVAPRQFGVAGAAQTGNNRVDAAQDALANSGDATTGSQRVKVHVEGDARWVRVLATNVAFGATAQTGDAVSANATQGAAGAGTTSSDGPAQAGQTGSNEVAVDQDARSRSGDAYAGSQEIDVRVTGSVGEVAILATNTAPGAVAQTGDAIASNAATVSAGAHAASGNGPAQAAQVGDNRVDVNQNAIAHSGDAVAGSQVIGVHVGGSVGTLNVLVANDATGAAARSGDALAGNVARAVAGPTALATNGDAATSQVGSNVVAVDQTAEAQSGRALAGAQVIAIEVAGGIGQSSIQPMNTSIGTLAASGNVVALNDASGSVGPQGSATGNASTLQAGSNDLTLAQDARPTSGDAVAGGQVVGIVEGGPLRPADTTFGEFARAA
jgi:hypothetical protein